MVEHPYFYLGVIFGVAFTVLNSLRFLTMSELGNVVHTKFQTFNNGCFSTIMSIAYFVAFEPEFFTNYSMKKN